MSKMTFEFNDAAEVEFYDIVDYYKQFDRSLSRDFIHEFEDAVQRLIKFPKAGHPYLHQTKRIFLKRFPYSIVYKIYRDELIMVFAIMHMKRKPDYWKRRLK
ncbi:MAG: type II toxin-antitoxin system RelE/ParE family toxin [Bacteroidetes bacterium]|jgi:plasmid stabilization system protein ParE|nr:type II toxin-antitoxin system RelE/ParE family toxin [Bacteroidota bacterium]